MKGKQLSLASKLASGVWTAAFLLLGNIATLQPNSTIPAGYSWEIIQQGIWFALLFSPVDISIIIQNFKSLRKIDVIKKGGEI